MKRLIIIAAILALASPAFAQRAGSGSTSTSGNQTTFRDAGGRTTGTATTSGNTTVYRDAGGRTTGTASTDSQNTTTFRDAGGRTVGSSSGGGRR